MWEWDGGVQSICFPLKCWQWSCCIRSRAPLFFSSVQLLCFFHLLNSASFSRSFLFYRNFSLCQLCCNTLATPSFLSLRFALTLAAGLAGVFPFNARYSLAPLACLHQLWSCLCLCVSVCVCVSALVYCALVSIYRFAATRSLTHSVTCSQFCAGEPFRGSLRAGESHREKG